MKALTIKERGGRGNFEAERLTRKRIRIAVDEHLDDLYDDPSAINLTPYQAKRLRDWLDGWLQEQKK